MSSLVINIEMEKSVLLFDKPKSCYEFLKLTLWDCPRILQGCTRSHHKMKIKATLKKFVEIPHHFPTLILTTAGWSSGLRSRLQNQRSRVRIPVVGRGFCDKQLHLLTSHCCLYILLSI
jgi:hypothetical protein